MAGFKLSLAGHGRAWHGKMCITTSVLSNEWETLCSLKATASILHFSFLSPNDGIQG